MPHTEPHLYVEVKELGSYIPINAIGSCRLCEGVTIYGVCMSCHGGVVCAWCGLVRQPDGEHWLAVDHLRNKSSHTICPECSKKIQAQWKKTKFEKEVKNGTVHN